MTSASSLHRGRESFGRQAWAAAYSELTAADRESPLEPRDLERLATAAFLTGRDADCADLWVRAHHAYHVLGDLERAARSAFWLAFRLLDRGEPAQASGWIARARRLLGAAHDSVEQGYLLFPSGLVSFAEGDHAAAYQTFCRVVTIGERFNDRDLVALARHAQGRALIRQGASAEGLALLDEAMVAVTAGDLSPVVVGDVYCSVISACHEIFDLHRAKEWTGALGRWCASQPDLVPYRGQCLVRRAEIMRLQGAWPEAMDEALRACARLSQPPGQAGVGSAFYQRAELHRLRGEMKQADEAYRDAGRLGRKPQPGLALLRLAQGQVDAAAAMIRGAVEEARERRNRPGVLAASVEILLAAQDVAAARAAADELALLATELGAPFLAAMDAHATGAVLLAEGDARAALRTLRQAWTIWSRLEAPYEAARAGVLIAIACRQLEDEDTGEMELDAARLAFERLGAVSALQTATSLSRIVRPHGAGGLTARESQVLRLVATGKTNRAVADALGISEKTVARHVSNIFVKLNLSTRAAAAAYAFRHDLA